VYFGTGDGQVIARDVGTGAQRWAAKAGAAGQRVDGANVVVRAGVVAVSVVGHTVGLDAATGRELWSYDAPPDTGLGSIGLAGQVVASHLDADDQAVYIPAWGASVSAVDRRTGAVRWAWRPGRAPTDTAASGRLFRSGAMGVRVSGDTVFATAWHFTVANGVRSEAWLVALDRATGRELWRAVLPNARGGIVRGAPALVGRYAVFNTSEVRVYAVDRATGRLGWEFAPPGSALTPFAQVEAYGDAVYVDGGDGQVYGLAAADGAVRSRAPIESQATRDLLVTERRVVVVEGDQLTVFDRATGRAVARTTQPRAAEFDRLFASAAASAGGRLFVTVNGAAWSFDEP
jgi:outer membrane protein assembly factor BamB